MELRDHVLWINKMLTRLKGPKGHIIPDNLQRMKNKTASKIADRILNLEKAFNILHANLGRKDDMPHERFLKEPITAGKYKGFVYSEDKWNAMLDHYYELHGWDTKTGYPTKKCLESLGLLDVARDLDKVNKLKAV